MEMVLTGEPISGEEAYKFGLVSRVYDDVDEMMEGVMELATKIAKKSSLAAGFVKRAVK